MSKPRTAKLLGVITVGLLAVAACGGNGSADSSSTGASGGTLTYGYAGGGLVSLNPNAITSATEKPVASLLFDSLTQAGRDGSVKPDLATSWKSSSDLKTWTFKLRSGVTFHSGKAFTAKDAVASVEYVLDPKNASSQRKRIAAVTSVTAKGDDTLVLRSSVPNALMPEALQWIYMTNVKTLADVNHNGDGTGPFQLSAFVPDDHLTLKRFDKYWGTKPKLAQIKITRAADTTSAMTSLNTGELDMLWGVDPSNVKTLKQQSSLAIAQPEVTSGTTIFEVDTTSKPFSNVKARQALSYATDRKTMLAAAYEGLGDSSPANNPISSKSPSYDGSLPSYDFDLAKAKKLFAEAGVKPGTTLTFWTMAGRHADWVTMGQILQQDLKKIGIKLQIRQEEQSTWVAKFAPAGKKFPNTIVANYLSLPQVPAYQLQFFTTGGCECNWNDKSFDSTLATAVGQQDAATRKSTLAKAQGMLNEQVPSIVLMQNATIVGMQAKLKGVWLEGDGTPRLAQASIG